MAATATGWQGITKWWARDWAYWGPWVGCGVSERVWWWGCVGWRVSLMFLGALQNILSKFVYCKNRSSYENLKLKLCMCSQSMHIHFSLKFSPKMWFLALSIFVRLFWRTRETLVKHPLVQSYGIMENDQHWFRIWLVAWWHNYHRFIYVEKAVPHWTYFLCINSMQIRQKGSSDH